MEKARKDGKPFYVNVWPDDVHSPYWPSYAVYGSAKEDGKRALYLAVLEEMEMAITFVTGSMSWIIVKACKRH